MWKDKSVNVSHPYPLGQHDPLITRPLTHFDYRSQNGLFKLDG
jgi:hypothetical protein